MRFAGQSEITAFLVQYPDQAGWLRAWLAEMKYRNWTNPGAIVADFPSVDVSRLPVAIFRLDPAGLRIETLIDFQNGIVLVTAIQRLTLIPERIQQIPGYPL